MMPDPEFDDITIAEAVTKHPLLFDLAFSTSRAPLLWTLKAPNDISQASEGINDEYYPPANNFDVFLQHVPTDLLSCPSQSTDQSPVSEFLSPKLDQDSPVITLPNSPPSSVSAGPSTSEYSHLNGLKIVQYSPSGTRKSRPTSRQSRDICSKPQRKRKHSSQSSRPDALKTEKACSLTSSVSYVIAKLRQTPRISIKLDVKGGIAGTECVFGLSQVVRATASKELQSATLTTRRVGACSRCRRHRIRVSSNYVGRLCRPADMRSAT